MYYMEYENFNINNKNNSFEQWSEAWSHMFTSPYFVLLMLTIILSYQNWKKPIFKVMILHWILRALAEGFKSVGLLRFGDDEVHRYSSSSSIGIIKKSYYKRESVSKWCGESYCFYSHTHWLYGQGFGLTFDYLGQIIGDWYLFLRTKAVVDSRKKMILPLIFLILFNLSKLFQLYNFFINYRDLLSDDKQGIIMSQFIKYKSSWTLINIIILLMSFIYELAILYTLKKYVFQDISEYLKNQNTFLAKFKKVSLYRLYITTSIALTFLIVLVIFVLGTYSKNNNESYIEAYMGEPVGLDSLQDYAINVNYYVIYLDQILLKKYTRINTNGTIKTISTSY